MSKVSRNKHLYLYRNWFKKTVPSLQEHYIFFRYHRLFFGSLIQRGRKLWAFKFFINLKYQLKRNLLIDPNLLFYAAMLKITPYILLTRKKIGSTIYGVPVYIGFNKQLIFAVKWVVKLLRDKYRRLIVNEVSNSLLGALFNKGLSFEQKKSVYKVAEENRHLLRYLK